jgi:hypothetical protein
MNCRGLGDTCLCLRLVLEWRCASSYRDFPEELLLYSQGRMRQKCCRGSSAKSIGPAKGKRVSACVGSTRRGLDLCSIADANYAISTLGGPNYLPRLNDARKKYETQ